MHSRIFLGLSFKVWDFISKSISEWKKFFQSQFIFFLILLLIGYLTGYRPLFGISDCWSKSLNPILCDSKWWSALKKLLAAFFDPKQAFFCLFEPLEVPNADKRPKVNVKLRPFQVIFFWNNCLDLTLGTSNCIWQKIQFGLYLKSGKPSNNFLMVCFVVFSLFKKNRKIKQTRFRESIFNLSVFTTLFWQFFKKQRSSLQECKQFQISHFWEIEKWNLPNKGKKRNKIHIN